MTMTAILASVDLTTTSNTTLLGPTSDTRSNVLINLTNRGGSTAKVRVAIAATSTPANGEWIEYDQPLAAAGAGGNVLERAGLVLPSGKYIVVRSDTTGVSATVTGLGQS